MFYTRRKAGVSVYEAPLIDFSLSSSDSAGC